MSSPAEKPVQKKTTAPPVHPPYKEMTIAAIVALKERKGASRQAIVKYIIANYKVGTTNPSKLVHTQLKKGIEAGIFQNASQNQNGYRYKLTDAGKTAAKKPAAKKPAKKTTPKPKPKKPAAKTTKKTAKPAAKKSTKSPAKKAKKTPVKKASTKKASTAKATTKKAATKKTTPKSKGVKKPAAKKTTNKTKK